MQAVSLPPTISVFGYKDSGKTTVTTKLIKHLTSNQYRILSAKHVAIADFSLDSPGTDSYRHIKAGATATFLHSEAATTLLLANPITRLQDLLYYGMHTIDADVIILEGFRFWTQKHPQIAKIICVRTLKEVAEFQVNTVSPILGMCSLDPRIQTVINIPEEFPFLLKAIDKWLQTAPRIPMVNKNEPK